MGKYLTTEKDFLQKVELSFKEQNFEQTIEFLYYVGKCLCVYLFKQKKKLRELGWCANYMMDKSKNNDFMTDFIFKNYSPNRRIIDNQQPINDFEICNCYYCNSFFE